MPYSLKIWLRFAVEIALLPMAAMVAWGRNHPAATVALVILVVVAALLGPGLWFIGGWDLIGANTSLALKAFKTIQEPDKQVEAYGKLVAAIGLLAAGPVGLIGVALAFWRSWNQHRDGMTAARKLDAEAFAKAVEQLGHDTSSIRMGAALALEALGKSAPRLLSQSIEILCAYVREIHPALPSVETDGTTAPPPTTPFPTDIKLILDVICRLKEQRSAKKIMVDLSRTDLGKANLSWANLSGANLSGANLSEASLSEANLSEAFLIRANLSRAFLGEANLSGAALNGTNLSGAKLRKANLSGAYLSGADLSEADLSKANLSEASLTNTTFKDTILPDGRKWTGTGLPP
ncbi:pentapeptide repeat-containing protein [Azospirillum cavernae]|nr:pentapeptide repeat-containing protein [Azospirillum cavernae]